MIRIFAGYEHRDVSGFHVFLQSLIHNTNEPFTVSPLVGDNQRDGTKAFTYARFKVPQLCDYEGWALFVDGADMMMRADVARLWRLRDDRYAVRVVKHDYKTSHPVKYIGTQMQAGNSDYPRKNWSSVILWNCGHPSNRNIDLSASGAHLHRFGWLKDEEIGELPPRWNHLVREFPTNDGAALLHYTLGVPLYPEYAHDEGADQWREHLRVLTQGATK